MKTEFAGRMSALQKQKMSDLVLLLTPRLLSMPLPIQRYDDPFLPFGKAIIKATVDLVCGYMFDMAAYLTLGGAGAVALERTVALVGHDALTILHAPFATPDFAAFASDNALNVDAVTVTSAALLPDYTRDPTRGAFVACAGEHNAVEYPVYWRQADELTHPEGITWRVAGESVLYGGQGDDFAEQVRAALERLRS